MTGRVFPVLFALMLAPAVAHSDPASPDPQEQKSGAPAGAASPNVPPKLAARVRVLSVGHGRKSDTDNAVSVAVAAQ